MSPRDQAASFITALAGNEGCTYQTFDDSGEGRSELVKQFNGGLRKLAGALAALNEIGAGVFVTVNQTDLRGRKAENVTALRALFIDADGVAIPKEWPIAPNIITQRDDTHWHAYWLLSNNEALEDFTPAQKHLAAYYRTDSKICDLSRVMRVPGFNHCKGDAVAVELIKCDKEPRRTIAEILAAHKLPDGCQLHAMPLNAKTLSNERAKAEPHTEPLGNTLKQFDAWAMKAAEDVVQGNRNHQLFKIAAEGAGRGIAQETVLEICKQHANGLSESEVVRTVKSAFSKERAANLPENPCQKYKVPSNATTPLNVTRNADSVSHNDVVPDQTFQFARKLLEANKALRPPIVHGLLREGETMNVIAPPKTGKTWLTLDLAISTATGRKWLGFETVPGRVLILDNELHAETIADRLPKVATARGISTEEYADQIAYDTLRGNLMDIYTLGARFVNITPGYFKLIILDAFYRFLPKDTDENDNGSMAALYNQLDAYANALRCAFVLIHHTSKGWQHARAVTDVGAGAGSISRAADCHLILRPHAEESAVVLDAAPRSWPPVTSTCLRFNFPVWLTAPELNPLELKKPTGKPKKAESTPAIDPPKPEWNTSNFVETFVTANPKLKGAIMEAANEKGISDYKAEKFLEKAEATGKIFRWTNGVNKPPSFATTPQPELNLQSHKTSGESQSGFSLKCNLRESTDAHPTPKPIRNTKKPASQKGQKSCK